MVDEALIYSAKMAGRITTDFYDVEVERLLNAAMLDLGVAGVVIPSEGLNFSLASSKHAFDLRDLLLRDSLTEVHRHHPALHLNLLQLPSWVSNICVCLSLGFV